jgi:hypothetical protein
MAKTEVIKKKVELAEQKRMLEAIENNHKELMDKHEKNNAEEVDNSFWAVEKKIREIFYMVSPEQMQNSTINT